MITKNTKLKRSYECILKAGTRTIKFRNDDVPAEFLDDLNTWSEKVLNGFRGIFGHDWQLIRTIDRTKK